MEPSCCWLLLQTLVTVAWIILRCGAWGGGLAQWMLWYRGQVLCQLNRSFGANNPVVLGRQVGASPSWNSRCSWYLGPVDNGVSGQVMHLLIFR